MQKNQPLYILLGIIAVLIAGGGGYFLGVAHGKGEVSTTVTSTSGLGFSGGGSGGSFGGGGFAGRRGGGAGGGFVVGTISSVGTGTITVENASTGASQTVDLSSTSTITKTVAGAISDLGIGTTVSVIGSQNSDGSVQATSVTIRPNTSAAPVPGA